VCVCVCGRERNRERERVCVCVFDMITLWGYLIIKWCVLVYHTMKFMHTVLVYHIITLGMCVTLWVYHIITLHICMTLLHDHIMSVSHHLTMNISHYCMFHIIQERADEHAKKSGCVCVHVRVCVSNMKIWQQVCLWACVCVRVCVK